MPCFVRDLIEYCGIDTISETAPCINITNGLIKQTSLNTAISVPIVKPDIEQIVRFSVDKVIIKDKTIKTPIGKSPEGSIMTGHKYVVMGEFRIKVLYVADNCSHSMNSFHVSVPFYQYLVLQKDFNQMCIISPTIVIEDIYAKQVSNRDISTNITFMLSANMC